jgi:CHAT domain-containing protein
LKNQVQSDFSYGVRSDIESIADSLESAKFFHFTGHGYGGIKSNGGLVLGNTPGSPGASILSYSLIRGLNLSGLRLAFLNCCQSGHAKSYPGNIATDISSSFLDAGTHFVIASVNNVDDFFACRFASCFYSQLFNNNCSIVDAFYRTVNEMPDSEKHYTLFTSLG